VSKISAPLRRRTSSGSESKVARLAGKLEGPAGGAGSARKIGPETTSEYPDRQVEQALPFVSSPGVEAAVAVRVFAVRRRARRS